MRLAHDVAGVEGLPCAPSPHTVLHMIRTSIRPRAVALSVLLCASPLLATTPATASDGARADGERRVDDGGARADDRALGTAASDGVLSERVRAERREAFNPYVIIPHRHNYVLPISYTSSLNESAYQRDDIPLREGLTPAEVKFQVSLKTQLNEEDLFLANDSLSFGLTIEAWWQLYASDLSSPFRETNYTPELFYLKPLLWGPFGGSTALSFGIVHQSNGQVQGLSRSWNRLYASFVYERGNFIASVRPWYRLPEEDKESPDDPEGDDNPDILDFMGHGELAFAWRDSRYEYSLRGHGNPDTGKGGVELGVTFPLFGRFRGYANYFNGYGESLIDYDHFQARVGLGLSLTNMF